MKLIVQDGDEILVEDFLFAVGTAALLAGSQMRALNVLPGPRPR